MTIGDLPAIDAALNALSATLLSAGWIAIRRKNIAVHKRLMLAAVVTSAIFLACYLTYHIHRTYVSGLGPTRFAGTGLARTVYFAILLSHTTLAAATLPLVLMTLARALRGQIDRHRVLARWTMPIWLYVSVTGVVVYLMLYQWYVPAA